MLDLDLIREQPDRVQEGARAKGEDVDIQDILEIDEERRSLQHELDQKRQRRNEGSEKVGELKQKGEDASELIEELSDLSDEISDGEDRLSELEDELDERIKWIPNLPADDVPHGSDESDNEEVRSWGERPTFESEPKTHWDLGEQLEILDIDRSAKLAGSGFYVLKGQGARLERALLNWMLDIHTGENGYREIQVPFLNRSDALEGTGQLPKLRRDMYRTDKDGLFLIPTSEVPLINLHREEILSEEDLPISYTGGTACFRREAGAAGTDTRGMNRVHQFQKVEMIKICEPGTAEKELDAMIADAEDILKKLNLQYRLLELCTGDLSFASRRTYDLEVYAPGQDRWLEVSSLSTCSDFQARRCDMRYRDEDGDLHYPHTLNGSGVALARTVIGVLEQHQNEDGTVTIPEPLVPYMNGKERLQPE
jgi:seryl-tRNA synthetase